MSRFLPRPTVADRGVVALVGLLCALVVLGAAGATAWMRTTSDDMARQVFADAPASSRQLQVFYSETRDGAVPADAGATVERAVAPALMALLEPPRHAVVTREAVAEALPKQPEYSPSYLSVVGFPDLDALVDVVEGRAPRPGHRTVRLAPRLAETYDGPRRVPIVEVALERRAAEEMDIGVGTYVDLVPLRYSRESPSVLALLQVSGLYDPVGKGRSQLDDVDNARRPAISTLPEFTLVRSAALAADVETVLNAPWAADPELRWTLDSRTLPTAAEAEALVDDARRLKVQAWPPVVESASSAAVTGLGDLATAFLAQRDASNTLAAMVLSALAAAALALLLGAASVLEARRREVTEVLRARGAGTARLAALRGGEAALVVAPGLLLVAALLPVTAVTWRDLLVALVAAVVCVVLLTAAQVSPWRQLPERVRVPARDALQIVVVALAAGLAVLMWTRDRLDASDPLLLALPVLLGVAAGILVVRGVRVVTAGVRHLAGRGRSVAPLVGASQAGTTAQQVMLPVVALVLAAGSGMLAVAVDDSVRRGAEAASWQPVGADVRVSDGQFDEPALAAIGDVPGVETVAPVHTVTGLLDTPTGSEQVTVVAVAPEELAEVASRGPDPTPVPEQRGDRLGIVAASDLQLDEPETTLRYAQATMPVTMTAEVDQIAGLEVGRAFVVVDAEALRVASDRSLLRAQTLLLAGDPDPARLTDVVHEAWPTATVTTRDDVTRRLVERPAAQRALLVARTSAVVSVLLALLATGLAVTLGRPVRRRTLEVLHALGGDPRQGRRVAALEMVPAVLGAGVAACGAVLLLLLSTGQGIDLAAVSGAAGGGAAGAGDAAGSGGLALGAVSWLVAAALLAGLVVLAAAASTWRTRRSSPHEGETR